MDCADALGEPTTSSNSPPAPKGASSSAERNFIVPRWARPEPTRQRFSPVRTSIVPPLRRAEAVAAIDPAGDLGYRPFPSSGTEGHAALLLVEVLRFSNRTSFSEADIVEETARLAEKFSRYWSRELVGSPERLARRAVDILFEARLAERDDGGVVRLLAGAGRFAPVVSQGALW